MSAKKFKFVSPGVFINEIDNSFIPRTADTIGPAVIGRATRGLAMQPVRVSSYSQFVENFGETVPGNGGGDIYRDGNLQSPMYGLYAAKAFLRPNVAPLTYMRLLGHQHPDNDGTSAAQAGWKTANNAGASGGGAFGLFVMNSASAQTAHIAGNTVDANLAAVLYVDNGMVELSGSVFGEQGSLLTSSMGTAINSDANGIFKLNIISGSTSAATATITTVAEASIVDTKDFTLTDAAGTTTTYNLSTGTATGGNGAAYTPGTTVTIGLVGTTTRADVRDQIVTRINAGTGIGFTAANSGDDVLVTQNTLGTAGNQTNTDEGTGLTVANFTGGTAESNEIINVSLDDTNKEYIREVLNTNPQLISSTGGTFYNSSALKSYWLGETYDQETRDVHSNLSTTLTGFIANLNLSSSIASSPSQMKGANSREAAAGWFIGQDLGNNESYSAEKMQKLFRLRGRGHGEYLNENLKVSITEIRKSNNSVDDYGSFNVLIRTLSDMDGSVQIVEQFSNCNLNPASPNFIARKIGDQFLQWSETERRLKLYGEYPNQSNYVYVEMNSDVEAGATDPTLLPFGYFGPPKYTNGNVIIASQASAQQIGSGLYFYLGSGMLAGAVTRKSFVSGGNATAPALGLSASLIYPDIRLRLSSSDGSTSRAEDVCFGIQTTRTAQSNRFDPSTRFVNRMLNNDIAQDPVDSVIAGIDPFGYVFSLDDIVATSDNTTFYQSGSRALGSSKSATGGYSSLLDLGFNSFTAPFFGGFDGLDITQPDPFRNKQFSAGSTERNSSPYYTILRAIDTLADPEAVDANMIVMPGLTNEGLTNRIIDVCEDRGDAMTIIDLEDGYIPPHEERKATKAAQIPNTPQQLATNLKNRVVDSSYAATFYPWVQTREESNGQLVWVPPSVAMMGVLASSERKSHLWFAPAGFNRGGLSEGAAGIPIVGVTTKLTSRERDTLYDARINPIASFPSTGIVVFGQKTLQERQSALDRINVRRLVIFLKKEISRISSTILFEQNVQATWNRFKGLVEPFLATVRTNFGISDYRLILDESTTTPDLVDQNILYAKIMVKPARAIEFIAIDFVVASTGASFDD